jgi:cyclopropane fatty-acyl-phospholipid synthase-like methyltransferase
MGDSVSGRSVVPDNSISERASYYKKEFWGKENLKFDEPWYRLQKSAVIINKLTRGRECTLLDVGCGPAALMRLLSSNIQYYGIDIAIQHPSPNLREADLLESAIAFEERRFDVIVALGVFEYMGKVQSQKFTEIARLLNEDGKFVVTYTNFSHRKKRIYEAFSNVQPLNEFRKSLEQNFNIDRFFPASHNWKHSQPSREFIKAANMYVNVNIPFISPLLAVDYFFICSLP